MWFDHYNDDVDIIEQSWPVQLGFKNGNYFNFFFTKNEGKNNMQCSSTFLVVVWVCGW
jgi:hypothetical protein